MVEKIKKYTINDGWLTIQYKGFFAQKRMDIFLKHIRAITWQKRIVKWMFILGLVITVLGCFFMTYFKTYLAMIEQYDYFIPLIGILLFILSFFVGKKLILVSTDLSVYPIPGIRKKSDYEKFFQEIVTASK